MKAFVFEAEYERITNAVRKVEAVQEMKQWRIHPGNIDDAQGSEARHESGRNNAHYKRDKEQCESLEDVGTSTAKSF